MNSDDLFRYFHSFTVWMVRGKKALWLLPYLMVWLTVIFIAQTLLSDRLDRVRYDYNIGHADSPAYAWQARQMAKGEGWQVPYVTNFLYRYDSEIDRADDQWAPLLSFALFPAFKWMGDTANVARMTTVWIGTLLLPFSFCLLIQALTRRAWPGLLAVLPLWFSMELFKQSTDILNDQLFTAVLCLFLATLMASRRFPAILWVCGPLIALAWFGKGSQVVLLPFFAIAVLLIHGPRFLLRREFLGALLLALWCMFPRLSQNARDFGNPLHSTQGVVSSFYGLSGGWDEGFYSIYWGRDLPGWSNRFAHPALHARSMARNTEFFLRYLWLGLDADKQDWEEIGDGPAKTADALRAGREAPGQILENAQWTDLHFPWRSKAMLLGLISGGLAMLLAAGQWFVVLFRKQAFPMTGQAPMMAILFAFAVMQALFMILFWHNDHLRLYYPALITASALVWGLLPRWPQRWRMPLWAVPVLTGLFCVAVWAHVHHALPTLRNAQQQAFRHPPPTQPEYPRFHKLGEQLSETLPADARIMARNPWQILWYAQPGLKGVGMPFAEPPDLFAVAKHYGVTHLVLDKYRPGLKSFLEENRRAFRTVIEKPFRVVEIDWEALALMPLTPLTDLKPLWDSGKEMAEQEQALQARWERERIKKERATYP